MSQEKNFDIAPEYIIEDLLEQNKKLAKEKAYQVAINLQLQEENKKILSVANNLDQNNKELTAKIAELEERLLKEIAKTAGPVPVGSRPEIIEAAE